MMCEYQVFNPNDDLPVCTVNNELCTLCVLGNAKTYNEAKEKENDHGRQIPNR